ncbi:hypothetical protein INT47_002129 [Mucor saturninus]|uniref:Uncharacterized protein n=1 Tax=Mucor saturninus TaxID=64648 RepID=A0A8H7R1L3_9FUNG|nr:hypothetical protein INT47_002129 [Mucor saturninus]
MKTILIVTLLIASFCAMVTALSIPFKDMSDFQITQLLITNQTVAENEGDIVYPQNYDTWYVGEHVNVTFKAEEPDETVNIFFYQKSDSLAGGPITQKVFDFVVPPSAVSGPNETSLLLAVRRENHYLQTVDAVMLHVLSAK